MPKGLDLEALAAFLSEDDEEDSWDEGDEGTDFDSLEEAMAWLNGSDDSPPPKKVTVPVKVPVSKSSITKKAKRRALLAEIKNDLDVLSQKISDSGLA